jgi:hypothetical protein
MRIILSLLGLILGIIIFMPKDNLFFLAQKELARQNVYINADIKNKPSALKLNNGTVYINQMDIMRFDACKITPFIFYNDVKCANVNVAGQYEIKKIDVSYSVVNPLKVIIKGNGNFGKIDGSIDVLKKEGKIYILNITNPLIKKILKKDNKGYYYYVKF